MPMQTLKTATAPLAARALRRRLAWVVLACGLVGVGAQAQAQGSAGAQAVAPLLFAISEGTSGGGNSMNDTTMAAKYKALTDVMEQALARKVQVRYVRDFGQLANGMRSGAFDLVLARPSDYPARGIRDHGYQAVTTTLPDGHCLLVVTKDSPFKTLQDLHGKRRILPEEAAYMAKFCLAELRDAKLTFDKTRVHHVKEQAAIPFALVNGLAQLGGIASYSGAAKKLDADGLRVLHTSRPQPYLPLVAGQRLTPAQVQQLRDAMVALSKTDEGGKALAVLGLKGFDTAPQARLLALLQWLEQ